MDSPVYLGGSEYLVLGTTSFVRVSQCYGVATVSVFLSFYPNTPVSSTTVLLSISKHVSLRLDICVLACNFSRRVFTDQLLFLHLDRLWEGIKLALFLIQI